MRKKKEKKEEIPLIVKKKMGRPTKYSEELADKICKAVSTSPYGLTQICRENMDFPDPETIRVWRLENLNFSGKYANAKLLQADILTEFCLDISDESKKDKIINEDGKEYFNGEYVARSRLRVDTRKWLASKLLPKQYGDRRELEEEKEKNEELREEIKALRAKLDEQNKRDY